MRQFSITEEQNEKINEWWKDHSLNCKFYDKEWEEVYVGAIGGAIKYEFTPTGLGVIVVVKCACGEELNVTNYEEW